jgi:hypothetical protein
MAQVPPRVVKIRRRAGEIVVGCDVYIGYPVRVGGWNLDHGKWANPYALSAFGKANLTAEHVARINRAYKEYILSTPALLNALHELAGKTLGCWCAPWPCHGDVLVELFRERFA